jgi:methionyl-tRNA formyltransferase
MLIPRFYTCQLEIIPYCVFRKISTMRNTLDYMPMGSEGKPNQFSHLRVLYMGMSGILSRTPLLLLLNAGVQICGLVLPAGVLPPYVLPRNGRLPTKPFIPELPPITTTIPLSQPDMLQLAATHRLPVYPIRRLKDAQTTPLLADAKPDLIVVSCFNQIVPPALLQLPPLGCLNVHPSLLPHWRGPNPLFWCFRSGGQHAGVTVHFMDETLDTGDIVAQTAVTFPNGISGAQAEQICATRGGHLLLTAVNQAAAGTLPRSPQPPGGSYQPAPRAADFALDTQWSAQHAFNFMRGVAEYGQPFVLHVAGQTVWLGTAVACHPHQSQTEPLRWQDSLVYIQCNPGVLVARPF